MRLGRVRVEDARRACGTIDDRTENKTQIVDEVGAEKRAVGATAAFEEQTFHAEFPIENFSVRERSR